MVHSVTIWRLLDRLARAVVVARARAVLFSAAASMGPLAGARTVLGVNYQRNAAPWWPQKKLATIARR